MSNETKPVPCACGRSPNVSDFVGGFKDEAARVFCGCGVSMEADERRLRPFAIERWNKLQEALRRGGWQG